MTEWGLKIFNAICTGRFGALWIVNMVKVVGKLEDFVAKFNKSSRAF